MNEHMITRIHGARIVDGGIKEGLFVYLLGGRIWRVTAEELPYDRAIDAKGNYLCAGWIDIHCHGGGGADFMDGGVEPIIRGAKLHMRHGTTSIYPTTLSASRESLARAVSDIREAMSYPTVRGAHLEGPYLDPNSCGAQNAVHIRGFDSAEIDRLLESGVVKRWDYAPELSGSERMTERLRLAGVLPSMGHSGATYEELLPSYVAGCRHVTHLYSATSTVVRKNGYRHLGMVESAFLLEDMTVEVIADGCHLPPELLRMIYRIKGADRICLVTDAMRAAGMPDGEYLLGNTADGVPCISEGGVAKLPDRSAFAGSTATADRLVRTMYKQVGVPLSDAVKMLTATPAALMGLDGKGRVLEGYDADLVIFDGEIEVHGVIVGGEVMFLR